MRKVVLCLCVGLLCSSMLLAGPPTGVSADQRTQTLAGKQALPGNVTSVSVESRPMVATNGPARSMTKALTVPADVRKNAFGTSRGCTCPAYMAYFDSGYYFAPGSADPSFANEVQLDPSATNISCVIVEEYVPSETTNVTIILIDGTCFSGGPEMLNTGPIGPLDPGYAWTITLDLQPDVLGTPASGILTVKHVYDTYTSGPLLAGPAIIGYCPDYFCWQGGYWWFGGNPHSAAHVEIYTDASPCDGACCMADGTCIGDMDFLTCIVDNGAKSWHKGESCATFQCPIPPPNDNCENAYDCGTIPVPGVCEYDGDNTGATVDCAILGAPEVWTKWTTTDLANVKIDLCDSPTYFGTVYIVYTIDCPCSTYYFVSSYDWNCGNPEVYIFGMAAGTYWYPQYSAPGFVGPYHLRVTTEVPPPPPDNDNCENAFSCDLPVPGQCVFEGDNSGSTSDCPLLGWAECWFKWTTTDAANIVMDVCDSPTYFGTLGIVYTIDCPCSNYYFVDTYDWNCGNWEWIKGGMAAGTYWYPMYSAPGATGPYVLKITASVPPPPPPNDNCDAPTDCGTIPVPGQCVVDGDNSGSTADCLLLGWPECWFKWTMDSGADVTIDWCDSPTYFATIGIVYTLDCPCSAYYFFSTYDWNCSPSNPQLYGYGMAAGTYLYPMYSALGNTGPYVLKITTVVPPPPPQCPDGTIFDQSPPYGPNDAWAFNTSGETSQFVYKVYDDFYGVSAPICDVHAWGLLLLYNFGWYPCGDEGALNWTVEFYDGVWTPPKSGNCCTPHGSPGCDDATCEASVCSYDSYCCSVQWDSICSSEAQSDPNCDCASDTPLGNLVCSYTTKPVIEDTGISYAGYPMKFLHWTLDPCCSLGAGVISIQSHYTVEDCTFLWATGPNGDGLAFQDQGGTWVPTADYAYCLTGGGAPTLCGDANCDGTIDNFDIDAFVLALVDPDGWKAKYSCDYLKANDTNCDGAVDNFDIDPFVYAISNGECQSPPCK